MTQRIHHRAAGVLTVALTVLALSTTAVPASARTFDFDSTGSMVQQPLPPGFACALQRAMPDPGVPCRDIYPSGDGAGAGVPFAARHGGLW